MVVLLALTTTVAFFVKGLTGFGPALIMVPVFSFFLPLTEVVPISGALLLVSNLPLAFSGWGSLKKRRFVPAALAFGTGVFFGGQLLVLLPEAVLLHVLGVALFGFCFYQVWGGLEVTTLPDYTLAEALRITSAAAVSGLIVGAVGAGALPLIIYLGLRYPKANFRLLITYVFLVGSVAQVLVYSSRGLYNPEVLSLTALLVLPMLLGLWLGARSFGRVDQRTFNRVVGVLLIVPAFNLLFG